MSGAIRECWTAFREIQRRLLRRAEIAVVAADEQTRQAWIAALLAKGGATAHLRAVDGSSNGLGSPDLALLILDGGPASWSQLATVLDKLDRDSVLAIVDGIRPAPARHDEIAESLGIPPARVIANGPVDQTLGRLAGGIFGSFHDLVIPVARQFPVLRPAMAASEVSATAKQNAFVGLLPMPGADMPIMTANQIKMLLRISAMYDLPITPARAQEILAVVGGGLGLRTCARQLVKLLPGPGWLVAGGIGYTGTVAMGRAAIWYFERSLERPPVLSVTLARTVPPSE